MRILAIDIGAGTQDVLLFDSEKKIENSISMVLPTPSRIFAERLRRIKGPVHISGDTIGGGALAGAIAEHLRKGYRVVMEEEAAYSIRNDLDQVRSMGIEVGGRSLSGPFEELKISEIDLPALEDFLSRFEIDLRVDVVAIAVQDHGVSPKGVSDRIFRFDQMEEMLRRDRRPETFCYGEDAIPPQFLRMKSAVAAAKRSTSAPVLVMDTSLSAILGCVDEVSGPSLIVNAGNGHTIGALVLDGKIEGLYEHHTHVLNSRKLEEDLRLFLRGELRREKVFEENGHGAITFTVLPGEVSVVVTGPNRDLFKGTSFHFLYGAPGGNTMMSGPMGLIKAAQYWLSSKTVE
jgi:uncharacterized protein (DUF1786 family)